MESQQGLILIWTTPLNRINCYKTMVNVHKGAHKLEQDVDAIENYIA